jgi:hypothetical protein
MMKGIKLGVLDEIKKLMGQKMAERIGKPKAMSIEVSAAIPKKESLAEGMDAMNEENEEGDEVEDLEQGLSLEKPGNDDELTPEEKEQLANIYQKLME